MDSWSRKRRVIGKAEITIRGKNPRFIVTSLEDEPTTVYEAIYCARGDMENRIKEQQLQLFATRTSGRLMRVNQVRLWFSSVAYVLLDELCRLGLAGTSLANAYCSTLRLKLLKIGARVRVTARKIWVSLASAHTLTRRSLLRLTTSSSGPDLPQPDPTTTQLTTLQNLSRTTVAGGRHQRSKRRPKPPGRSTEQPRSTLLGPVAIIADDQNQKNRSIARSVRRSG